MTNKQKILDEILSLEPELKDKKEELSKLLDNIVNIKPDIKISEAFRLDLKNKLLAKNSENILKNNKFNYFQTISSFLIGAFAAFGIAGMIGLDFDKIDNQKNLDNSSVNLYKEPKENIEEIESFPMERNTKTSPMGIMMMSESLEESEEVESNMDDSIAQFDMAIENYINPATEYCLEKGGKIETKDYMNYCIIDKNYSCEEWSFYNGKCRLEIELDKYFDTNNLDKKYTNEIIDLIESYRY